MITPPPIQNDPLDFLNNVKKVHYKISGISPKRPKGNAPWQFFSTICYFMVAVMIIFNPILLLIVVPIILAIKAHDRNYKQRERHFRQSGRQ